jgi:ATP-binding cassette, subfamily B, bacterial
MIHRAHTGLGLYRRLMLEARPYRRHIAGLFGLSMLSSAFALLTPLPLKIAVDSVVGSHPLPAFIAPFVPAGMRQSQTGVLLAAAGLLVLISLLKQLQEFANLTLSTYTGEKLLLEFRSRLFRHAERLSLAYHDSIGTADSAYRIQYDAAAIQSVAVTGLIPFFTAIVTVAGMIYVTARIDWQLALVSLAVAPVLFLAMRAYRKRLRAQWHEAKRLDSAALSVVQESLESLRVVKAFGREDHVRDRFADRSGASMRAKVGLAYVEGRFGLVIGATIGVGMGTILFLGTRRVLAGAITLGELVLVMGYLEQLYDPLKTASKKVGSLQSSLASAERVYSLLDQAPDFVDPPDARPLTRAMGAVSFRNVSFAYESGHRALHDVSFAVAPGARLGIAGTTGAGKTTLVSLLTRFYDPTSGQILLDGTDLRRYRLRDLRNQFAIVLQEPVLFSTSIAENLAYARPGADQAALVAAAKAASAHEFISALPDGYSTPVGERGVRLSGGERQRIALARAFLKDAPILILDEPTSSVDERTEAEILGAMERLMKGRTTFMIAHRTSTLAICDARLELEHGRVLRKPGADQSSEGPPAGVVELARRLAAREWREARLEGIEELRASRPGRVYRVGFEATVGTHSIVVKRHRPRRARANRLVAERWLPAVGLGAICPATRGVCVEPGSEAVWQLYADLPGDGLDCLHPDQARVNAVVELLAELHGRLAEHALLDECREHAYDLGIGFFTAQLARCSGVLASLGSAGSRLSREQGELTDRLRRRLEGLSLDWQRRVDLARSAEECVTLLHGDLWTTNTLVVGQNGRFEARLIDWDNVGVGPISYDISTFLYRFPAEHRPWILARYRHAIARHGVRLPDDATLNVLFETAEYGRYVWCLGEVAVAARRGEAWAFEEMADIETWFAQLETAGQALEVR